MTLLDLAARCESATRPEMELDAAIYQALNPHMRPIPASRGRFFDPVKTSLLAAKAHHMSGSATGIAPCYTASTVAALMLVPEGWAWMAGCAAGETFFATLSPTDESGIEADMIDTNAATPALALCAAALRALAQIEGQEA